jgi:hypothetical protein
MIVGCRDASRAGLASIRRAPEDQAMLPSLKTSALAAAAFGLSVLAAPQAQAFFILEETFTVIEGTFQLPPENQKRATGEIVINVPGNPPLVSTMPPEGGILISGVPGVRASAEVDLAAQRTRHMWASDASSGVTEHAEADIEVRKVAPPPVEFAIVLVEFVLSIDPLEIVDIYFSPGASGEIEFNIDLLETTTGTPLFSSTSTLTDASGDVVTDDSGAATWTRTPGFYSGDTGGIPNEFSENRWELSMAPQSAFMEIALDPGDPLGDFEFAFVVGSAGEATGSGLYGVSDAMIPTPPSLPLLLGGLFLLALARVQARRRG